jgi:hypothetical protein
MKFKALIASLLVSTSSVALADDYSAFNGRLEGDISLRDHRDGEWRRRPQWMPISQMVTASRRTTINIDERNDELRAIRLQNGTGATYVYSITLRYEDGHRENISVGKWLYAGVPMLTFDLAQRKGEVDRIVINTWTSVRSTFQVMGQKVRRFERPPIAQPQPLPHPPTPPIYTPPAHSLVLGKDLTFAGTAGYVHLPVGLDKGNFHKVRVEGMGAGSFIGRVYVTFPTGLHQSFEVNKVLYRGETIDFDLTGTTQQITAITVMAGNTDVRAQGQSASRFAVTLL